jgi:hypothetical protein
MKPSLPFSSITYPQTRLKPLLKKQFAVSAKDGYSKCDNPDVIVIETASTSVRRAYDIRTRKVKSQLGSHTVQLEDFKEVSSKEGDILKQLKLEKLKVFQDLYMIEDNYKRKFGLRARFDQLKNFNSQAVRVCNKIASRLEDGMRLHSKLDDLLNSLKSTHEFEPVPDLYNFATLKSENYPKYNELLFSGELKFKHHIVSLSLHINRFTNTHSLTLSISHKSQVFYEEDFPNQFKLLRSLQFEDLEGYKKTVLSSLELRHVSSNLLQTSKIFKKFLPL